MSKQMVVNLIFYNSVLLLLLAFLRFYHIENLEIIVLSKPTSLCCMFQLVFQNVKISRIRQPDFLDISCVMKTITKFSYVTGY